MHRARSALRIGTLGVTAALPLVLSSCSSSSLNTPSNPPAHTTTGTPITVGFTTVVNDPIVGDFSVATTGAQAAVKYVNDHGGIEGHPIMLSTCPQTSSTGGANCANQFVAAKVPAVLMGLVIQSQQLFSVLRNAKIPAIGSGITDPGDYIDTGYHWSFNGGPAAQLPAIASYAVSHGTKSVSAVFEDVPGVQVQEDEVKTAFNALGVSNVHVITAPANSSDPLATLSAANQSKPDALFIGFTGSNCATAMRDVTQLGIKAKTFYFSACYSKDVLNAAGSAGDGAYMASEVLTNDIAPSNPDVKQFVNSMTAAGDSGDDTNQFAEIGYQDVMLFVQAAKSITYAKLSPAAVATYFATSATRPLFLADQYSCASPPIPSIKPLCSDAARIVQINNGKVVDVGGKWYSARKS